MDDGFWDRLAERVRPTEALRSIEDPRVLVRAITLGMWAAVGQVLVSAGLWAGFGESAVALGAVVLACAFLLAWIWFALTGSIFTAVVIAFVSGTLGNIYAHVKLGGFAYSGGVFLFGIVFVAIAALLLGRRMAIAGAVVHAVVAVLLAALEGSLRSSRSAPDQMLTTILFVVVLVGSINVLVPLIVYFMGRLRHERERAEGLLLNILPATVARELKERGTTTARRFEDVSVLFADIVGFTPRSTTVSPEEVVRELNEVFTRFDSLAERHGVEKIRTMGDSYMVAAGVPQPRRDHAEALAAMALDMRAFAETVPLPFRIGISSGPVVAGVIGTRKFQYDIWGDTVNAAARMEAHGLPGRIHVSDATHRLIEDRFVMTPRGSVEVKGMGVLATWWLEEARPAAEVPDP